ncbi:hypothetical protein CHRY9390_02370 [Chryseobacterium aquaeductus]|uniref:Secretion system C-terminal sorting domain-containing protein n=1 Tax=Chryseobacterium aquaeductus TaxID=2675056 RepID=A0A9N8MPG9_9FLAO|nr:BspA family leucine-rich repeat surface protein [Chryseobacterium aquaeductus]CAA7331657.1 hypothetical protein CHRY9390_02370 [Chryseobacterium potabilaquae]CAD7811521.1 hypothetical protein CHRY9390_02370 [Chryseobacterium aquaeductus]
MKKLITIFVCIFLFQITQAQNEFITIWKPGISQQIHFPGRGTNFHVVWEEVGYTQHNGNLTNVNSTLEFIINFGTPLNPVPANATYKVKISNGNGNYNRICFFDNTVVPIYSSPDTGKLLTITQWGNIQWQTFENAFILCNNMDVTALDTPNLSIVTSTKDMFYICSSLVGNTSFGNWDTSNLTSINSMFSAADQFNAPIGNWDVSNVTDFYAVFDMAASFNQPIRNWDTSNATTMEHMFHGAGSFNQNIDTWDISGVTNMDMMFAQAYSFNQNIGSWNLSSLTSAVDMLKFSGLNCQNYDNALFGWNNNSQTPNNINLGTTTPLTYKHQFAVNARTNLINSKNWMITGDNYNASCNSVLGTSETDFTSSLSIYPNPATHSIFIKSKEKVKSAEIIDASGRLISRVLNPNEEINIQQLSKGNYFLKIETENKKSTLKFIKN